MLLIIGIPNSGKTTYSQRYDNVIHYDDISRLSMAERTEIAAKAEVVEGIYNTRKSRLRLLSKTTDTYNICIWIDTPVEVCLERERTGRMRGEHLVLNHAQMFEPPTLDEGWDKIIIIKYE